MSAIEHLPGSTWAATHRAFSLVAALLLLLVSGAVTVVLLTGGSAAPAIPADGGDAYVDTCFGAPVGSAC